MTGKLIAAMAGVLMLSASAAGAVEGVPDVCTVAAGGYMIGP